MDLVFCSPMITSCSLRFAAMASHSSLSLPISYLSSSTRSRKMPHCRDMVSCRRPQLGLPLVHFFHWPPAGGSSFTGSWGTVKVGTTTVVVLMEDVSCCCCSFNCRKPVPFLET